METIYIQHFLRQLDHATTQGSALERSIVTTATEKYLFSLQSHIKEDLVLFVSYLVADSSTAFGFRGIMKNDDLVDAGSSNPKCVSLITRPKNGQGDVLASLCIKASASVLSDIFGSKDTEIKLALASPTPHVYFEHAETTPTHIETATITVTPKVEVPNNNVKKEEAAKPQVSPAPEPVKVEFADDDLEKLTTPDLPAASLSAIVGDQSSSKPGKEVLTPKKKPHIVSKPN